MMKSLYSGVAGMKVHNQRMDVIGNNVSNVNTTGYKASNVTFKDIYYQTKKNASSGDANVGGTNPTQIGYGAMLGTVTQVMTQSGFTYTDSEYDCALEGEGFFQVMDTAGNTYYTRAGVFSVDSYGNLCDPNGNIVLGVSGDPSNVETGQSQRITLNVPPVDDNKASCTKTVNGYEVTISANDYGEQGNIAFTIVDANTPYATRSGQNLTIYMDLDQDFGKTQYDELLALDPATVTDQQKKDAFDSAVLEFQQAINNAVYQGGVDFEDGVLPFSLEFDSMPNYQDVLAKSASNILKLPAKTDASGTAVPAVGLQFTARTPGAYANKYEIDIKVSDAQSNSVSAKWKGDVLTITLPKSLDNLADPTAAIQTAIDQAANGNDKMLLDFALVDADGNTMANGNDSLKNYGIDTFFETYTQRLGLEGGKDNFFSDMAIALSTVTLQNGRVASEQYVDDLETVQIDRDGIIYGRHAVHGLLQLGRIDVVTFENPMGLDQVGTSMWRASQASGEPQVKIPGSDGAGRVISGAREMSNVDLAQEFSDMIITQRGYQANSRIITVSDTMLEELVNLKR